MIVRVFFQKLIRMTIFIQSAAQISIQEPLCERWFEAPICPKSRHCRAIDADYAQFLNPMKMRRAGNFLKRALTTSIVAANQAKINEFDAIITGTGLGCTENTEKFFLSIFENDEQLLQPTFFMQSTHNTINAQIGLHFKNHNYNSTYSHNGISFENALLDAVMQFELGKIRTALVGAHEEMTPLFFSLFDKINYWKKGEISTEILRAGNTVGSFAGENSVSFALQNWATPETLCALSGLTLMYAPSDEVLQKELTKMLQRADIQIDSIDAVVCGLSGDGHNDEVYRRAAETLFKGIPVVWYKHLFGESFCSSAMGTYVAATCLQKKVIPTHLFYTPQQPIENPRNVLIFNHFQNKNYAIILLKKC